MQLRSVLYALSGLVTLVLGFLLWVSFAAASAFSSGFGGREISWTWFLIPTVITLGGPALFWVVLPIRHRRRVRESE